MKKIKLFPKSKFAVQAGLLAFFLGAGCAAPQPASAIEAGDADLMFNGFNQAFLVNSSFYANSIKDKKPIDTWRSSLTIMIAEDAYERTGNAKDKALVGELCSSWLQWSEDGWPRAPLGARRSEPMPAPMGVQQKPMIPLSDDFRAAQLRPTWQAWNERDMNRFQVGNGTLTMRAKGETLAESSPLAIMARDPSYQVQVTATPPAEGAVALGLFYNVNNGLWLEVKGGELRVYDAKQSLNTRPWKAGRTHLKIVNRRNQVDFLASANGWDWISLVTNHDVSDYMHNKRGGFQALRPALAATGTGNAQFSDFVYSGR